MTVNELHPMNSTPEAAGATGEALYDAIRTLHTQIGRLVSEEIVLPGVKTGMDTTAFTIDSIATSEAAAAKFKESFGTGAEWELQTGRISFPPQGRLRATLDVRVQRQSSVTGEHIVEEANKTRPEWRYPVSPSAVAFHLNTQPWENPQGKLDETFTSILHVRADLAPQGTPVTVKGDFGRPLANTERGQTLKRDTGREVEGWHTFAQHLIGESIAPIFPEQYLGGKAYTIWEKAPATPKSIDALATAVGILSRFIGASATG